MNTNIEQETINIEVGFGQLRKTPDMNRDRLVWGANQKILRSSRPRLTVNSIASVGQANDRVTAPIYSVGRASFPA